MTLVLALLVGYACGSIPFGLLFARLGGAGDVRTIGSGNIGATNVLRTGRKGLAFATLLADMMKATLPAMAFIWAGFSIEHAVAAGFGAFLGHCYPIWLRFVGGKGIATYIGALLAVSWKGVLLFALIWLAVAAITRLSSAAALLATVVVPVLLFFTQPETLFVCFGFAAMTIVTWWKHRANIQRLMSGTESKIGQKG